jgi:hypothetical protein
MVSTLPLDHQDRLLKEKLKNTLLNTDSWKVLREVYCSSEWPII